MNPFEKLLQTEWNQDKQKRCEQLLKTLKSDKNVAKANDITYQIPNINKEIPLYARKHLQRLKEKYSMDGLQLEGQVPRDIKKLDDKKGAATFTAFGSAPEKRRMTGLEFEIYR